MNSKHTHNQLTKSVKTRKLRPENSLLTSSRPLKLSKSESKMQKPKTTLELNNYRIILNKLLTFKNYNQLITYATRFIPKEILQCEVKDILDFKAVVNNRIGEKLISDGIFIRHLIETKEKDRKEGQAGALKSLQYFKKLIKINRKLFHEYAMAVQNKCLQTSEERQWSQQTEPNQNSKDIQFNFETAGSNQRNNLPFLSKSKKYQINQSESKTKVQTFDDYVASHKKEIQQSIRVVKKKMQASESHRSQEIQRISNMLGDMYSPIKRKSIRQNNQICQPIEKLTDKVLSTLPIIEQNVIKRYFPNVTKIGRRQYGISIVGETSVLGDFEEYEIIEIGIEYRNMEGEENNLNIDLAAMMKPKQHRSQREAQSLRQMQIIQRIRIFLTN